MAIFMQMMLSAACHIEEGIADCGGDITAALSSFGDDVGDIRFHDAFF